MMKKFKTQKEEQLTVKKQDLNLLNAQLNHKIAEARLEFYYLESLECSKEVGERLVRLYNLIEGAAEALDKFNESL